MEKPVVAATEEQQKEQHDGTANKEVDVKLDEDVTPDYTGHNGADPVTPNQGMHAVANETSGSNDVQVLGVYEAQGDQGQTMQAAVLTNGEEVAAVVDLDGDGTAEVIVVDENHNQQIDEGEVYDISDHHVQMSDYQDIIAQQQDQMQQEHDIFVNNTGDDQPDYNNDADLSYT